MTQILNRDVPIKLTDEQCSKAKAHRTMVSSSIIIRLLPITFGLISMIIAIVPQYPDSKPIDLSIILFILMPTIAFGVGQEIVAMFYNEDSKVVGILIDDITNQNETCKCATLADLTSALETLDSTLNKVPKRSLRYVVREILSILKSKS
ncbi:hypothetical protein NXS08_04375 [Gleimia sp. 6138-11-ORH1]|uniref:hypothetical protein n=1 Tax=Gleimia sp. 6138-11-ORH1 TaxID=2973937 RepID=UPI0021676FB5|nr:hypothetical protein [Gleimia sp. 6138-11-ORH1]MCS4484717.1 hypothetical protein [Gleimia sp. 6138-11-ORH1]